MAYHDFALGAHKAGIIDPNTIRVFKVAYPVLRIRVDIRTVTDKQEFHLIQKYIHNLVAGDSPSLPPLSQSNPPICFIRDKREALRLLGLDHESYDVASYFYDDLVYSGRICETSGGLLPGDIAGGVKTDRGSRVKKNATYIIVDPFDCRICHKSVKRLKPRELHDPELRKSCILNPPSYIYRPEELERLINEKNFDFSQCTEESYAQRLLDQDLPVGTQGVELVSGEGASPVQVLYFIYYLVVRRQQGKRSYHLYVGSSGKEVELFDLNADDHKAVRNLVDRLSESTWQQRLYFKLSKNSAVGLKNEKGQLESNVIATLDERYTVDLTDGDLCRALMDGETKDMLSLVTMLLEGAPFVLSDLEAGRLIQFRLTLRQKQLCNQLLEAPAQRQALLEAFCPTIAADENAE